jgi:hypothetical protein
LQEDNRKIGNVEACQDGYQVRINNQVAQFKTIRMLQQRVNIEFEHIPKTSKTRIGHEVHGYPTAGRAHNPSGMCPANYLCLPKLPKARVGMLQDGMLFKQGRHWETLQDPKLIVLQRYPYHGPFLTKEQADEHTPTKVC